MDIAAIPRVNSIVLTGLDFSMKPEHARFESSKGFIKPFHELKAMHLIKSLAVMVYNQEKLTPYFHSNVCDGRNSLAYFICAVHRQQAPQPPKKNHSRQNSASSENSNSSKSSSTSSTCKLANPGENCDLPKLCTTSMLPLGYWDSLYYALVAEIRQLHGEITNKYGFACEIENPTLHQQGPHGTTDQPITAIDLASMLETAWYALMDNRLVAALDDAVSMKNLREEAAKEGQNTDGKPLFDDVTNNEFFADDIDHEEASTWPPPIINGLIDVNAYTPEAIVTLLWDKHAPEINRVCLEDYEDEAMLTAYRAALHAKKVEEAIAANTPLPSASFCSCYRTCMCKLKCDENTDKCTCLNGRAQIYHLVRQQESTKHTVHKTYVKPHQNVPNPFLGAATNTLAQMQIAALANPNPVIVQACHNIHDANNACELQVANKTRQRSDTTESQLAYIPLSKPTPRAVKDAYPLNFYGDTSPQRYPRMPSRTHASHPVADHPSSDARTLSTSMPTRKPLPPPIVTNVNVYGAFNSHPKPQPRELTPPASATFDGQTFTGTGQVMYPSIPVSQSEMMFTQSFPLTTIGNPREISYKSFDNEKNMDHQNDPAQEYIGLLSRHPSTIEHGEKTAEPFPSYSQAKTSGAAQNVATSHATPTLKTVDSIKESSQPPLPQPDFIAPRPAVKQRYVSAGGNAKLCERAEITGPAFTTPMPSTGGTISKEELDAKMSDLEWVRRNFGEAALGINGSLSPPRPSVDSKVTSQRNSKVNSQRNSGRNSSESQHSKNADKRDRTSSGASGGRVAKLKRVFSRKSGECEHD